MITLAAVNSLTPEAFAAAFGDVAEHSPWVARHAAGARPFASRDAMVAAFAGALAGATPESQLALIRAHPDLAGKTRLSTDSGKEQVSAGLGSLSAAELARFNHLNSLYRAKFDFPFIFAVKGATKGMILNAFAERVNNSAEKEFAFALSEITRILRLRIEDRVAP